MPFCALLECTPWDNGRGMPEEPDAYELLGVSREAGLEEVREAYHRAALKWHPDRRPDDPAEAARRFCDLTQAYQTIVRSFGRRSEAMTPQDFARADGGWVILTGPGDAGQGKTPSRLRPFRVSYATVDENRVFACVWAAILALPVLFLLVAAFSSPDEHDELLGALAKATILCSAIYPAAIVAILTALVFSRQVFWLLRKVGLGRLLPGPPKRVQASDTQFTSPRPAGGGNS